MSDSESNVDVREIRTSDVASVAQLHCGAFPGYANVLLGRRYVESMLSWYILEPTAIALGAFDNNSTMVGYVIGVDLESQSRLSRDLLPAVVRGIGVRPWLLLAPTIFKKFIYRLKGVFIRRDNPPWAELPAPVMGLFGIAVAADARGKGVGRKLMRCFEAESQSRAAKSLLLSVFAENSSARTLYEQSGWSTLPSSRDARVVYFAKSIGPRNVTHPYVAESTTT